MVAGLLAVSIPSIVRFGRTLGSSCRLRLGAICLHMYILARYGGRFQKSCSTLVTKLRAWGQITYKFSGYQPVPPYTRYPPLT